MSSGRLVGAVSGRTCATHHQEPVGSGTQSVRSAKARSANSCQSATSRRAWSTWDGLDPAPRVSRSERLLMVAPRLWPRPEAHAEPARCEEDGVLSLGFLRGPERFLPVRRVRPT